MARRLYLGKEAIEESSGVGIILVSPDEKMHSYAIRLKFNASDHVMDCEALLAGLIEGNHTPATVQERKYKEEVMDATAPFHSTISHLGSGTSTINSTLLSFALKQAERSRDKLSGKHPRIQKQGAASVDSFTIGGETRASLEARALAERTNF
ncbi:hypothetical protein Tco_0045390 [Tanacetum coccineum]